MAYDLKPFVINTNDLVYLLNQVNFQPLFDASGNAIVAWDGQSIVRDAQNNVVDPTGMTQADAWAAYGHGFPTVSAPIGIRDVTGFHNNLFGTQAMWGAVEATFVRLAPADYGSYITSPLADYTPGNSVTDLMPRIISRTITTGGVNLLLDGSNHYVTWDAARYGSDTAYAALINSAGFDTLAERANLVEGVKIVAPVTTEIAILDNNGAPLFYAAGLYTQSLVYTTTLSVFAAIAVGGLKDSAGGTLTEGEAIWYRTVAGAALINTGLTYQPDALVYKQLIDANVDFSVAAPVDGTLIVTTLIESGYGLLETLGHIDYQNPISGEFFIGSENPGVAPVNSWFAIFGQFFDHGLDKLAAGGNGKITIALDPSDPLYGAPGPQGPVTSITVTRATIVGVDGNLDPAYINHTSPFIDQSQTYGSHEQLTNLLREWVIDPVTGTFKAGMELFDGTTLVDAWIKKTPLYYQDTGLTTIVETPVHDTLPTLAELRAHLVATDREDLSWADVLDLRNRDANGDVILTGTGAGNSGSPLLLDMNPHFDAAHVPALDLGILNAQLTLAGIANFTATSLSYGGLIGAGLINPSTNMVNSTLFGSPGGTVISVDLQKAVGNVLLNSVGDHYIAGDGRVNENFGLTSIHHVFHEEHNYQVENLKTWIYAHDDNNSPVDHAGLHEWQNKVVVSAGAPASGVLTVGDHYEDANGNYVNKTGVVTWDADKMFNATKLIVEMEYQHAAVDQYARTITPRIQEFVGYSSGVDSTITLEYAQVAFRFGHSTIRETIDTIDPTGWFKGAVTTYALESAFLAPQTFAQEGTAAIVLGLSRQQMNEVDEFITPALNQGLLGQPLDLAAINIARGRDMGIPTLNDFREAISLARYTSWSDFGINMFHPESLVTFMSAYSFGGLAAGVAIAQEILDLVDGVITSGSGTEGFTTAEAFAFMNNNVSGDAILDAARSGFNHIDSWIGGLAEAHVPGGLLGETFDAVFVAQIQSLMDGDRFYYLYRLFGTQIAEEVNNGQFKDLVERNTGLEHLNGSIFAYADKYYQLADNAGGTGDAYKDEHSYGAQLLANPGVGMYSDGGATTANNGSIITIDGVNYISDIRPELDPTQTHPLEGTPVSGADSHEVIVGTDNKDFIHARGGDDTVYGDNGDDILYGDGGIDRLYGGAGNDYLDSGEGPDLVDGGAGKDTIYGRGSGSEVGGFDQLVGGSGNDLIIGGEGIDKLSSGSGDDIVFGDGLTNPEMGNTDPFTHGGDGNDYMDGGASGDLLYGDEGDDMIVGGQDQDLMLGGQGDDILRPGAPSQAIGGGPDEVVGDDGYENTGFDLVDFSDYAAGGPGITISLINQTNPLIAIDGTTPIPAMAQLEGIIGSSNNDTLGGEIVEDLITAKIESNNWLIGGSGNDTMSGGLGNDLIIGGSVQLDTLIGSYSGAAHASLQLGSTAWMVDAMQTGVIGTGIGYDNNTEDAYTGASNRATGSLSGGLLAGVNATITGATNDYELHFTEMIRSRMFRDAVLGDGGTDGTGDTAVFSGDYAQYTLQAFNVNGVVIADPHANWASVYALRVTDNRTADDLLDGNGDPILDANGDPITLDGSDLIVGVEKFQFADQTINPATYFDKAPALDLNYAAGTVTVVSDNFSGNGNAYGRGTGWGNNNNWTKSGDNNNSGSGQILVDTAGAGGTNSGLHITGGATVGSFDGATISRAVNLSSDQAATLNFSVQQLGLGTGETVKVYLLGATPTALDVPLYTIQIGADAVATTHNIPLSGPFPANARLYFVSSAMNVTTDDVYIDNISITAVRDTATPAGTGNAIAYTENAAGTSITTLPHISDPDDTLIFSATAHIRETIAGDQLAVGALPVGITVTGSGTGTVTLSSTTGASFATFQDALKVISFLSTSDNPTNASRHIDVTVNDGLKDSNVATTTVTVTPVNDPTVTGADNVITDIAVGNATSNNIVIPDWALLANDSDPDSTLSISSIGGGTNGILTSGNNASGLGHANSTVTIRDTAAPVGGTFTYTVNGVTGNVAVAQQTPVGSTLTGTANADIFITTSAVVTINGGDGNDVIFGNSASNTLNGGTGDDKISYTVTTSGGGNNPTVTSGRDIVDGGTDTPLGVNGRDTGTDTFILNGANGGETFKIMTRAEALLHGITGLNANTEIVITRQNGNNVAATTFTNMVVLAELDNIEEIQVNTLAVTADNNNGGLDGQNGSGNNGDAVQILGNFGTSTNATTSLNFNTVTINGGANDKVDISGLTSDHRIVFNGATNLNQVIGDLRPQDVVNYEPSSNAGSGTSGSGGSSGSTGTDESGGGHSGTNDNVGFGEDDDNSDGDNTGSGTGSGGGTVVPPPSPALAAAADQTLIGDDTANLLTGASGDDVAMGRGADDMISTDAGDDFVDAGAGADTVVAGAGDDTVYGQDGADSIFGGAGNDLIDAGNGDDNAFGGADNDTFVGKANDGSDSYHGDAGVDTLDMSAVMANIEVNLGTGLAGWAKVGAVSDQLYSIENIVTGSGDDTITTSAAVNVIDTGTHSAAGHDTVVFKAASDADGDTILNFEAGDKIDVSGFMGGSVSLINGTTAAAGQIAVSFENVGGENFTVLHGVDGNDNDFQVNIKGHHNLTGTDFAA